MYTTPIKVAASHLKHIRECMIKRLGKDNIRHVVITVPAYFTSAEKEATIKAGI